MATSLQLTDKQRAALERLHRNGPNGHAAIHRGSLPGLLKRGLVSKGRSWENNGNGRVVWRITDLGRVALGIPLTVRAAGTLDFTVHLRDPDVPAKVTPARESGSQYRALTERPEGSLEDRFQTREWNGHLGATVCGRRMLLDELWVNYVPDDPRDVNCPQCFGEDLPAADDTLLWEDWDDGGIAEWPPDDTPPRRTETVNVAGNVL